MPEAQKLEVAELGFKQSGFTVSAGTLQSWSTCLLARIIRLLKGKC